MTTPTHTRPVDIAAAKVRRVPGWLRGMYAGNARAVMWRSWQALTTSNLATVISGFFEPVLYLLAMGLGMGGLVGEVTGPGGSKISYAAYIAPALLATSAMNGAVYDTTYNVFFKVRMSKLYKVMLQTTLGPIDVAIGEIAMALLRGLMYAAGFMIVMVAMGLVSSWWALAMIPAALLVALGFAAFGMGVTSFLRTFQQMDLVNFVLLPMFLFSATLYPITVYPEPVQWLVKAMPLWHGVEMMRQLSVGHITAATGGHIVYFVVMSLLGIWLTSSRLRALFLR